MQDYLTQAVIVRTIFLVEVPVYTALPLPGYLLPFLLNPTEQGVTVLDTAACRFGPTIAL